MTSKEKIMKLQTYKMFVGEDTLYVERDDVLKLLEQEFCEDCISREDAIMCMTGEYVADMTYKPEDIISKHIRRLRALPPVIPQEPKRGYWIKVELPSRDAHECSECGNLALFDECRNEEMLTNFCPNCGSNNREVEE